MSYTSHSVDNLGSPFLLLDEATFVIPKGGTMRLSKHRFKLLFFLNGSIEHEIEGLGGRHKLGSGDILIAPVVGRHDYINPDKRRATSVHLIRLFLDADKLAKQARRRSKHPEHEILDFILHHFTRVTQLKGGIDVEIMSLIDAHRQEAERRLPGHRHRVRCLAIELLIAVARRMGGQELPSLPSEKNPTGKIVSAAREYIFKHFATDLTLGEIAWHVGKGEEHLARVFKQETGESVFDYVREMRISHSKTLLVDTSTSLTRIAEECGFHSLSFFSRTFRQHTGMTPSQYRQHMGTMVSGEWPQ